MDNEIELTNEQMIEALDRIDVTLDYVDMTLANHPLISNIPDLSDDVERIIELMGDLYQRIAQYESIEELLDDLDVEVLDEEEAALLKPH